MLYRLKLLHCSILETFRWNEISILIFSGPYLYVIKLKTQTIYWNWLIKTLIITRLSSLGVGVSRTVMSVQREQITVQEVPRVQFQQQANFFQLTLQHQWFGFGDFVLVIGSGRKMRGWKDCITLAKMLWLKHFEKERSMRREEREGGGGIEKKESNKSTGNSLVKYWVRVLCHSNMHWIHPLQLKD